MQKVIITFAIGLVGVFIFKYFSLPLPWMMGPVLSVAIASNLPNITTQKLTSNIANPARVVIGVTVGSAFSASIINDLDNYMFSILLIIPFILLSTIFGVLYYHKLGGIDKNSAFFASQPGGFVEMVILAQSSGADVRKVILAQSSRLMIIVLALPFLIHTFLNIELPKSNAGNALPSIINIQINDALLMLLCGLTGWWIASKIKLGAASLLGPMAVSMVFYVFDFIHQRPPFELLNLVQLILGASIGSSFSGIGFKEFSKTLLFGAGHFIILLLLSLIFGVFSVWITGENWLSVLLAFSPGGQSDMNLIAILVGANVPFVALHHTFRLFIVMAILPVMHRNFDKFIKKKI
ncbi:ammonia monooxygenase [Malaciobacter molluscorum LMG 25693]|uniref:Ammonia monooxygenase n=1 Tax=Malaciobacter molluscorum LMG 25693 TaxID=870501 RepID=A0A2G1DFX1_9BACT|nr:AbrB family transcriptional regulator [Malaciobacter molluscorum]AXX93646.1 putative ammonia monooxygenase [Malaciobacter molluscorum LMG 25693]PHO17350.1 ammonia monooxygenase [Malaciobacter molluscorum LMG 25693]